MLKDIPITMPHHALNHIVVIILTQACRREAFNIISDSVIDI